jgi:hypothetical protein
MLMRWLARIAAVTLAVLVIGLGCSGTSGDDGGANGDGNDDNGSVNYTLVGTCDVSDTSASTCAEYWHEPNEELQMYGETTEALCENNWTSDEEVCPTSGSYEGTCVTTKDETKVKVHHDDVNANELESLRSGCKDANNQTWMVE